MAINYQDRIRTLDGDMHLEDVPENTPIGHAYKKVQREMDEYAKVNVPYEKLRRKESQVQAMVEAADIENTTPEEVEAADIENTTPEEFALAKAELELITRKLQKLKPDVSHLTRAVQIAGENLARLQSEHSDIVNKYLTQRSGLTTSAVDALKRQILYNYSVAESV